MGELVDPFDVLDTDSGGFPTILFRTLSGNVSRVRSSSLGSAAECLQSEAPALASVKSEAPTIYDVEGLPVLAKHRHRHSEDCLVAITPNTR